MAEGDAQRRLAAIVAIDVAGYSRLMGADEQGTLATLKLHRDALTQLVENHEGRLVGQAGDGLLLEFPSVVEAVTCAIEMQAAMAERNEEIPDDKKMLFRIGINLGDVLVDGDDIFGDGVNVAARLEGLAEPGGICISNSAHEQVRDRIEITFDDMGEVEVKNIARPVRVFRVLLDGGNVAAETKTFARFPNWRWAAAALLIAAIVGSGAYWWLLDSSKQGLRDTVGLPAGTPSIAVLPFEDTSGDKRLAALARGFTDDITLELSRFKELSIIGRQATASARSKGANALSVGQELGVRYVVTGTLRNAGDQARVVVNLVDVRSGSDIWTERFDFNQDAQNFFELQDRTVGSIVAAIASDFGALTKARFTDSRGRAPESLIAYECVLQAQRFFSTFDPKEFGPARECLENTVKKEPEYAEAWAWLGGLYQEQVASGFDPKKTDSLDQARRAIDNALRIAPNNQQALLFLVEDHFHRRKLDNAIKVAERAIALNPNNTGMVMTLGFFIAHSGDCEQGLKIISDSVKRVPGLPTWRHNAFIRCLFDQRKYKQVVDYIDDLYSQGTPMGPGTLRNANLFKIAALYALDRKEESSKVALKFQEEAGGLLAGWVQTAKYWYEPDLIQEVMIALKAANVWPPNAKD